MTRLSQIMVLVLLILVLTACGGEGLTNPTPKPEVINSFKAEPVSNNGNSQEGEKIFYRMPCMSCHTYKGSGGTQGVAPALDKIGTNADSRLPGVTAAQYIRHVILKPEDIRLPDMRNVMPSFANTLKPQELDDLVAFLLTLK
jgi:mono/diheme cytochrome c family protein